MDNKKKLVGVISGAVLVLAIIVVFGIIYAAFSQQLNINGSAKVEGSNWKIVFKTVSEAELTGTAKELTHPTINGTSTTIGNYSVSLTSPGDSVSYTITVKNEGTYPAKIGNVTLLTPTCTGTDADATKAAADAVKVCGNGSDKASKLTYTLKNVVNNVVGNDVAANDTLDPNETKTMKLTLSYASFNDHNELPGNDVNIGSLNVAINYVQSGYSGQTNATSTMSN